MSSRVKYNIKVVLMQSEKAKPNEPGKRPDDSANREELSEFAKLLMQRSNDKIASSVEPSSNVDQRVKLLKRISNRVDKILLGQGYSLSKESSEGLGNYFATGILDKLLISEEDEEIAYANAILFIGRLMFDAASKHQQTIETDTLTLVKIRLCLWPFCEKAKK